MNYISSEIFVQKRGTASSWGRRRRVRVCHCRVKELLGGVLVRLGWQQQEEMKSLIQNSLKLGEKPQTTEVFD